MLEFSWPWLLLALPLPLAAYFWLPKAHAHEAALLVPFFQRAQQLQTGLAHSSRLPWLPKGLAWLMWACLVAAAARPQWVSEPIGLPSSGRDLLMAVDLSGSMQIEDMPVGNTTLSRIDVIKNVVGEFVKRRESDRLGLVLFGSQAYVQAPLTFDRLTVNRFLQEAQLGFAGEKTAIGDALGLCIKRLKDRPDNSRVVILLTDGANTSGEIDPKQAADLAKQAGVKIYTIGLGANEMQQEGILGITRTVNPSADLDEATLTYIANTTGGQYFRARDPKELANIYSELDKLEPIEQDAAQFRPTQPLFYWPLAAALALSLVHILLRLPRLRLAFWI